MKSEQKDMSPPSSDTGIRITDETLSVSLSDGRTIAAPLTWFPRLMDASPEERENRRFIGKGEGIHWPDLDEDISIKGLIAGKPSAESQRSLKKWLEKRWIGLASSNGRQNSGS